MRAVSLFAGIGGFDLALEAAGVTVAAQSEIEPFARKLLTKRFPGTRLLGDVANVKGADLGAVDLLAGGFPCQDLSVAGKRAGLAGGRSGLFWEIARLARELAPRWLLLENVPGLLSSQRGRDYAAVLGALGELGYGFAARVLDAQHYGLAQRRRRVFLVGCLGDARRAAEVLFEPESCSRNPAPRRQAGSRPAFRLTASVRGTGDGHGNAWNTDYVYNPYRTLERDGTVTAGFKPDNIVDALHGPTGNKEPLIAATLGSEMGRNRGLGNANEDGFLVVATLNAGGNNGGFRTEPAEHLVVHALSSHHGRLDPNGEDYVTHPLRGEGADGSEDGTGRGTPIIGGRRLMPLECERLQGFPDGWTCLHDHPQQCDCPDSPRYRALGNAVAVPVAAWIVRRLVARQLEAFE